MKYNYFILRCEMFSMDQRLIDFVQRQKLTPKMSMDELKKLRMKLHPDRGGDTESFNMLQAVIDGHLSDAGFDEVNAYAKHVQTCGRLTIYVEPVSGYVKVVFPRSEVAQTFYDNACKLKAKINSYKDGKNAFIYKGHSWLTGSVTKDVNAVTWKMPPGTVLLSTVQSKHDIPKETRTWIVS